MSFRNSSRNRRSVSANLLVMFCSCTVHHLSQFVYCGQLQTTVVKLYMSVKQGYA